MAGARAKESVELRDGLSARPSFLWAAVLAGVVLAAVLYFSGPRLAHTLMGRSTRYYEDASSRSVMVRDFYGPIQRSERILYTTPRFDPAKAAWAPGVRTAFDEPIRADSWLVMCDSSGTNILHIRSIARHGLDWTHFDTAGLRLGDGTSSNDMPLLTTGPALKWAWNGTAEGILWADDFFLKPLPQLTSVALIRSVTNGITEVTNRLGTLKFGKLPYEPIGN